jgi:heptosyltransferase-1
MPANRPSYELAIDTQGLLKSALITRMAPGRRCGYAAGSAREPLASRGYDSALRGASEPARRGAQSPAGCPGGRLPGAPASPDYGMVRAPLLPRMKLPAATAVLLTASSRDDKLWPEDRWVSLGQMLHRARAALPVARRQRL